MRDREPTFKPENIEYTVTKTLTKAPNNLLISKNTGGYLALTNGLLRFIEEAPDQPKKIVWYKISAGIHHWGNHFGCEILDSDNTYRIHSDDMLYPRLRPEQTDAEFSNKSCVLLLRKVGEEVISPVTKTA